MASGSGWGGGSNGKAGSAKDRRVRLYGGNRKSTSSSMYEFMKSRGGHINPPKRGY